MPSFPVIDEWNKDPEFQRLPYDVKRQKVEAYFDAYHADPEFRALPEGHQAEIKNRVVVAHLGDAPAPPTAIETAPGAFIDGWTQGSLEIPKSIGTAMDYAGHRIKGDGTRLDRYTKDPNVAMKLMTDHQRQRVGQKITKGLAYSEAVRAVWDEDDKLRKDIGETISFMGKGVQEYYADLQKPYQMPSDLQGKNVWDNPEILTDPRWWAYGTGNMGPSLVATLLPAGAVRTATVRVGSLIVPKDPQSMARLAKTANLFGAIAGSLAGGTMEGAQTYRAVLEETKNRWKATQAAEVMERFNRGLNAIGSPAFLEALGGELLSHSQTAMRRDSVEEGFKDPAKFGAEVLAQLLTEGTLPEGVQQLHFKDALKASLAIKPGMALSDTEMPPHYDQADLTKMADFHKIVDQVIDEILNGEQGALKPSPVESTGPDR